MLADSLVVDATRIALAILLDTGALIIWDIGTRSPRRLIADVRVGVREPSALMRGVLRFLAGAVALYAAASISAPVVTSAFDFTVIECGALITALAVEQLVGPALRTTRR